jgi:ssDNA-binding Zn-finger/Zn-ribbon topoisomerase 1
MSNKTTIATWTLELNCECPKCGEDIDLLDDSDFWEHNRLETCEHETDNSRGIDAICEMCEHEFKVDLAY